MLIHLLDEKDTPDYWFKQLINELLKEMKISQYFIILDEDEVLPNDTHAIIIQTQNTYDVPIYKSKHVANEWKVVKVQVKAGLKTTARDDDYTRLALTLNASLNHWLSQRSFPDFYIHQLTRTSTSKRVGFDRNYNPMYDTRFEFNFVKELETVFVPDIEERP